jgi:hypothetical protein
MNSKSFPSSVSPILPGVLAVSLLLVLLSAFAVNGPVCAAVTILTENFDATTPPNLPSGWSVTDVNGTAGDWTTRVGTWHPSGYPPHSSPNVAVFNSWSASTGNSTRLFRTTGINLSYVTATTLTFWIFHDGQYNNNDTVQPQVSIDGGTTWNNVGSAISRYMAGTYAWLQHTVSLSAYMGQTDVRIGFLGISAYGNDCHIDDVEVSGVPEANLVIGDAVSTTGNLVVPKVSYTSPREHVTSVGSEAFFPISNVDYVNGGGSGGAWKPVGAGGGMAASVQLPDGARVTKFRVYFYDNSSQDLDISLSYQGLMWGGYVNMARVTTSGAADAYSYLETTSISYPVIDNIDKGYLIWVYPLNTWDDFNLRVKGASISYTLSEAP